MSLLNNECKGCSLSREDGKMGLCFAPPHFIKDKTNEEYNCPCLNCLIKVMCDKICPDYHKYKLLYWSHITSIVRNQKIDNMRQNRLYLKKYEKSKYRM